MTRNPFLNRTCSVEGCERKHSGRGYCQLHLWRMNKHGTTDKVPYSRPIRDPEQRFWENVEFVNECWIWTGTYRDDGYGIFYTGKERTIRKAYRWAYEHFIGPVPEGLELDHLCHFMCPGGPTCPHRRCVNPHHLEPVTGLVNTRRSIAARQRYKEFGPFILVPDQPLP